MDDKSPKFTIQDDSCEVAPRRLIPVAKFNDYHPDPSPSALRWMIYMNKNNINECVIRRGRRVLIDEMKYFAWLERLQK